jgi:hypothetical protein
MDNHYSYMCEYLRSLADDVGCDAGHDGGNASQCDHCQLRGIAGDIDRMGERLEAAEAEAETARLELSQERWMRAAAEAECERLRKALVYVKDWLPMVFDSSATYDKIKVLVGDALRDNSGQDAAGG